MKTLLNNSFGVALVIVMLAIALSVASSAYSAGLSVLPEAAFSGERGMRVQLYNANPAFLIDSTPSAEARYRFRFWLNLDSLELAPGQSLDVLHARNQGGQVQLRVIVQSEADGRFLNIEVREDNGSNADIQQADRALIRSAWRAIEVDWRASTAPGANNGHVHIWVDGTQVPGHENLDTDQRQIDEVRFGFVDTTADGPFTISGSFDLDEFISRNDNYIGLAPTTVGIGNVVAQDIDAPAVIGLAPLFDDFEDGGEGLNYTVVSNTNPALFSQVTVDNTAKTITLGFTAGSAGTADITVRATDTDNLFVETTFSVTVSIAPPGPASNPVPADEAADVPLDQVLAWTAGDRADSHDVYFGTSNPPDFVQNQPETAFDPGALQPETNYFWRIDAVNEGGTTQGELWTFTTVADGLFGDVNGDGVVDAVDIQLVINAVLGIIDEPGADLNGDGEIDAVDVQLVINTVLGV